MTRGGCGAQFEREDAGALAELLKRQKLQALDPLAALNAWLPGALREVRPRPSAVVCERPCCSCQSRVDRAGACQSSAERCCAVRARARARRGYAPGSTSRPGTRRSCPPLLRRWRRRSCMRPSRRPRWAPLLACRLARAPCLRPLGAAGGSCLTWALAEREPGAAHPGAGRPGRPGKRARQGGQGAEPAAGAGGGRAGLFPVERLPERVRGCCRGLAL